MVLIIQERVFARVFAALHSITDARCFWPIPFAPRYAELRVFAAKNPQTVGNDRENFLSSDSFSRPLSRAANVITCSLWIPRLCSLWSVCLFAVRCLGL